MANVDITLSIQGESVLSDTPALTVVDGGTFTVLASGGTAALFFSPDLSAVVSPQPSGPVTLEDGQNAAFTFTSSEAGGYFIFYGPVGLDLEVGFPPQISNILYLETFAAAIAPPVAGGVTTPPKGGTGPVLNPQGVD